MRSPLFSTIALAAVLTLPGLAEARPAVVIDAATGRVLHAEEATALWYPASLTKLMTTYVVLSAVREGRVSLDTPLLYSAHAQAQPASKMGFPVNTIITVDNALKILLVKSANDVAVAIAEGISGSVDAFAAEMNRYAQGLGMTQSHFKNPNGWHDPDQVTSARDMAILGRALYRDFPAYDGYFKIGALQLGKRVIRGHNRLLGRFKGADGMKTGFTCPSGFNLVASATRGRRQLIAVVLGHSSSKERTERAAELLDAGFGKWMFWRTGQEVATLPAMGGSAPNLRPEICEKRKKRGEPEEAVGETEDDGEHIVATRNKALSGLVSSFAAEPKDLLTAPAPVVPVPIFLGPNPNGPPEFIALAAKLSPTRGAVPTDSAAADNEPAKKKAQPKPQKKKAEAKPKPEKAAASAEPAAKPKPK